VATFTVDTKLFRELGELLVGRDSTALVELIKNAYDADATRVDIIGTDLEDPDKGVIVIADDGVGMGADDFERGFLRIAGRTKTESDRRSPWFKRRYTGEKGVGRLAAHKLARKLNVVSRKWNEKVPRDEAAGFAASEGVKAAIDWDRVERLETLAQVAKSNAVAVEVLPRSEVRDRSAGTRLTLKGLRRAWTTKALKTFFDEVTTLTPPTALYEPLPSSVVSQKTILDTIQVRDAKREAGFEIAFAEDFALSEPDIAAVVETASWVIEILYDAPSRTLKLSVMPTTRMREEFANAEPFELKRKLSGDSPNISFQARIFQRQYTAWPAAYRGVKVYYEGFRVLPYGDPKDDWLDLDRDYRSRGRGELGRLRQFSNWNLPEGDPGEGLVLQGNLQFFGAVFFTREQAGDLKILVNREGFLPGKSFDFVADMVRLGIDLQIRQGYAARTVAKQARKIDHERQQKAAARSAAAEAPTAFLITSLQNDALGSLRDARAALARGDVRTARANLSTVETKVASARELSGETATEATMYRVLASMGLEQAAFIHEVNAIAVLAQGVSRNLEAIASTIKEQKLHRRLSSVASECRDIRDRLRRNAVYLADMTGIEGRRRRSRQFLHERFTKVADFLSPSAARRRVAVEVAIPERLRTPPMFPAELSAIFTNLLSNAIKFAGENGKIQATAQAEDDEFVFRLENTGTAVDLKTARRWFEPFRSSTSEVDESLGQGMGLGLTVTRSLLDEYGGTIEFVPPSKNFATAIELRIPTNE